MSGRGRISRPRVLNTCEECKRRKLKCDKERPACQRCRNSKTQCVYVSDVEQPREYRFVDERPRNAQPQSPVSVAGGKHRGSTSTESGAGAVAVSSERLRDVETRLEMLSSMVHTIQSSEGPASGGASDESEDGSAHTPKKARQLANLPGSVAMSGTGHLDLQSGGRTRYVGDAFWACICDEAAELEELLRSQNRYHVPPPAKDKSVVSTSQIEDSADEEEISETLSLPFRTKSQTTGQSVGGLLQHPPAWQADQRVTSKFQRPLPDITDGIPTREQCDALLEAFTYDYHPIVPLVHIPTIQEEYKRYWTTNARQPGIRRNSRFIPLMLAIIFAGSVVCAGEKFREAFGPSTSREDLSTSLYLLATKMLRMANFPRTPTIDSFTAYLIIQGTWMRDEEPLTCCAFVGTAVRVAQMLGLNKEPSQFKKIPPIAAEVRRRIWWHVYNVDVLVAVASGLHPLIDQESWDVQPVCELKEEFIGTTEGLLYQKAIVEGKIRPARVDEEGSMLSAPGVFIGGKLADTVVTRRLLSRLYGQQAIQRKDVADMQGELERAKADMLSRAARIPEYPTGEPTYQSNKHFNSWARLLLSALSDKNWCFAYSPMLRSSISHAWIQLYPMVHYRCRDFLQKFVYLSCIDDFQPFQWCWPGNHQPLHAIMVLLKEVDKDPYSIDADASRTVIDEAFALCGPDGGMTGQQDDELMRRPLTEGGQEAWDLIKRLRSRAWQKANLDPDVMWTREEVKRVARERLGPSDEGVVGGGEEAGRGTQQDPRSVAVHPPPGEQQQHQTGETHEADMTALLAASPGGPTPNIDWNEWDETFGESNLLGMDFGDINFELE